MHNGLAFLVIATITSEAAMGDSPAEVVAKLDSAEALWNRTEPSAYAFRVTFRGMVRPADCMDGFLAVVAAGVSQDLQGCESVRADYDTIPALFRLIRAELSQAPEEVDVKFDQSYGYPIEFYVNPRKDIHDEESGFAIRDFKCNTRTAPPNTSLERTREE